MRCIFMFMKVLCHKISNMIMQALRYKGSITLIFFSCFLQFILAIILFMSCLSHSSHVLEISESTLHTPFLKTACNLMFHVLSDGNEAQRYEEGRLLWQRWRDINLHGFQVILPWMCKTLQLTGFQQS